METIFWILLLVLDINESIPNICPHTLWGLALDWILCLWCSCPRKASFWILLDHWYQIYIHRLGKTYFKQIIHKYYIKLMAISFHPNQVGLKSLKLWMMQVEKAHLTLHLHAFLHSFNISKYLITWRVFALSIWNSHDV